MASKFWAGAEPTRKELSALSDDPDVIFDLFEYASARLNRDEPNDPVNLWIIDAVWILDIEVNNGGFAQYFWNRGPEHALWLLKALLQIGDIGRAQLMEKAIETYRRNETSVNSFRSQKDLAAFQEFEKHDYFADLDRPFWKLGDSGPTVVNYVRSHSDHFADR